jgi:hypothetical protein
MKTFNIEITETLSRVITIDALDIEEALELVIDQYNAGDIVLDHQDFMNYEVEAI